MKFRVAGVIFSFIARHMPVLCSVGWGRHFFKSAPLHLGCETDWLWLYI